MGVRGDYVVMYWPVPSVINSWPFELGGISGRLAIGLTSAMRIEYIPRRPESNISIKKDGEIRRPLAVLIQEVIYPKLKPIQLERSKVPRIERIGSIGERALTRTVH